MNAAAGWCVSDRDDSLEGVEGVLSRVAVGKLLSRIATGDEATTLGLDKEGEPVVAAFPAPSRLKALELLVKLAGYAAPARKQIEAKIESTQLEWDFTSLTDAELEALEGLSKKALPKAGD